MGCHFLLQGTFPTQLLKPGLPHCRQTLNRLSHHFLLQGTFPTQLLKPGLPHGRQTLNRLSHRGSPSRVQLFCDHMCCSPQGSSVHGILQARIPDWVDYPFSRGSGFDPGIQPVSPALAGGLFSTEPPGRLTADTFGIAFGGRENDLELK